MLLRKKLIKFIEKGADKQKAGAGKMPWHRL
jgi:hypothetical protein